MAFLRPFRELQPAQRRAFIACFLGWSLDAFDFFLLTFCLDAVASTYHVSLPQVADSITWTLCMRPLGALLFGYLAERFGRRPTLMLNILCFSVFEFASAFAPTFPLFLASRALFGIAMGGEWGVGAALALESLPAERRGFFSGLLQEGYVTGHLLAAAVFGLVFPHLHLLGHLAPWRWLFVIGAVPSLLVIYIRAGVKESPAWLSRERSGRARQSLRSIVTDVGRYLPSFLFLIVLMFAFNSLSHGTQDLYPTSLKHDHGMSAHFVSWVSIVGDIGALLGGMCFGAWSERYGRKRMIVTAALLAIPVIPLWGWAPNAVLLALGGFLMQFMVQGAWGIVPAHLNELSPAPVRALFPGLAYQLGNLLSSRNGHFQAAIAEERFRGHLAPVMAMTVLGVAVLVAAVAGAGREARGAELSGA